MGWFPLTFFIFVVFCCLWMGGWRLFNTDTVVKLASEQLALTLLLLVSLFFIGYYLDFTGFVARLGLPAMSVLIFAYLIGNYLVTGSVEFDARQQFGTEEVATYQGFATSMMIMSVISITGQVELWRKLALVLVALISLFMMGARSEFVAFVVSCFALSGAMTIHSIQGRIFTGLMFVIFVVLWFNYQDVFMQTRQAELLQVGSSSSVIARLEFNEIAWEQIRQSPLFGVFGGNFLTLEGGEYAHNMLSAWVTLGAVGFLLYGVLAFTPFFTAVRQVIFQRNTQPVWWAALQLGVIVALLVVISKPMFWEVPGLLWGVFAQALRRQVPAHAPAYPARPHAGVLT
jgi:hypothetical protein